MSTRKNIIVLSFLFLVVFEVGAVFASDPIDDENLVLWLKLDEKIGDIAHDSSKHKNHGKLVNFDFSETSGWATRSRPGLLFDGIDDYVEVPDSKELRLDKEFTIDMWLKIISPPNSTRPILGKGSCSGPPDYAINLRAGGEVQVEIRSSTDTFIWLNMGFIPSYDWHRITITYKEKYFRMYVDGRTGSIGMSGEGRFIDGQYVKEAYTDPIKKSSKPLCIGEYRPSNATSAIHSNIMISNVTIFSRTFSHSEIIGQRESTDITLVLISFVISLLVGTLIYALGPWHLDKQKHTSPKKGS